MAKKTTPDYEDDFDVHTDMTDVNGASGAMDEDGELDTVDEDVDNSPIVQSMALKVAHIKGQPLTTTIVAEVHTSTGIASKRTTLPGALTAKRLSDIIHNVSDW